MSWTRGRRLALAGAVVITVLVAGGWLAWRQAQARWYLGQLPAQIHVDGMVQASVSQALIEGCGAVVFTLADDTVREVQQRGLPALQAARQARAHGKARGAYGPWRETPHRPDGDGMSLADRWLLGLNCADLPADLDDAIQAALAAKGAYYATTAEGGLIVIPARRLAVFSFDG